MKKIICFLIVTSLLAALGGAFALEAGQARAVFGADLTEEQVALVCESFGLRRGDVAELTVTNDEERHYLNGLVEDSVIGSHAISCVYIETLPEGSGLQLQTSNITWCTKEMYLNALVTAGIDDAKVIVSAPWAVSGTAGLTGIYKAYEDISGEKLDELSKLVGTQELVVTAELADEIGSYDAVTIVNELKLLLDETKNMTDNELREEIRRIAEQYEVKITDGQIQQLVSLCRSLEKMGVGELKEKVESVQNALKKISQAQEKASGVLQGIKNVIRSIADFFTNLFGRFRGAR